MPVAFFGLGGGGARVVQSIYDLVVSLEADNLGPEGEERQPEGLWVFGRWARGGNGKPYLAHGAGFAVIDAFSGDMRDIQGVFGEDRIYRIADHEGFGGDWRDAYATIKRLEPDRSEENGASIAGPWSPSRGPVQVAPYAEFRDELGAYLASVAIPCFSADGGAGRGAFEYFLERRTDTFRQDAIFLPLMVIPTLARLRNGAIIQSVTEYTSEVTRKFLRQSGGSTILADYDLAHANYGLLSSTNPSRAAQELDAAYYQLARGVKQGNKNDVAAAMRQFPLKFPGRPDYVDRGIASAVLPLFGGLINGCINPRNRFSIREPKSIDPTDMRNYFPGQYVVPCMWATNESSDDLRKRFRQDGVYDQVQNDLGIAPNILVPLLQDTITKHSLFPLPVEKYEDLREIVGSMIIVVWGRDGIMYPADINPVQDYISTAFAPQDRTSKLDVYVLQGADPLRNYFPGNTHASSATFRVWAFVGIKDHNYVNRVLRIFDANDQTAGMGG